MRLKKDGFRSLENAPMLINIARNKKMIILI